MFNKMYTGIIFDRDRYGIIFFGHVHIYLSSFLFFMMII